MRTIIVKYILEVVFFTTHKVVRNQSSCIYYRDIIKWSVDMQDYVKLEDVQTHVDKITKQISGGDIVLFHFSEEHSLNTLQLLPLFLSRLENKGFKYKSMNASVL